MAAALSSSPARRLTFRFTMWFFTLLTVIPFGLLLLTSVKSKQDLFRGAYSLPDYPHFETYVSAWVDGHCGTYFRNSIIVVHLIFRRTFIEGLTAGASK